MVNERNEFEDDEESEYHFSDDQISYEMEPDVTKTSTVPASSKSIKDTLIENANKYRRVILSTLGFLILIFIVYKMLIPASTTQTEITQPAAISTPVQTTPAPEVAQQQAPPSQQVAPPGFEQQQPAQQQLPQQQMMPPAPEMQAPGQPGTMMPTQNQMQQQVAPPPPQQQQYAVQQQQPAAPMTQTMAAPTNAPPPAMEMQQAEQKNIVDRLAALEEQNVRLMNLLQTQFAQKIADYDAQSKAVQERVGVVNKRLSNIEASLNKMAQLIQDEGPHKAPPKAMAVAHVTGEPKVSYVVQAIIPGRAWLKSESGDTVTVAENDLIKDFGRVVKIDPYDGIVEIDIGNKIIALSYGSGSD